MRRWLDDCRGSLRHVTQPNTICEGPRHSLPCREELVLFETVSVQECTRQFARAFARALGRHKLRLHLVSAHDTLGKRVVCVPLQPRSNIGDAKGAPQALRRAGPVCDADGWPGLAFWRQPIETLISFEESQIFPRDLNLEVPPGSNRERFANGWMDLPDSDRLFPQAELQVEP